MSSSNISNENDRVGGAAAASVVDDKQTARIRSIIEANFDEEINYKQFELDTISQVSRCNR